MCIHGARDSYSGRGPLEFIQKLCKQVFTKGLGTYTYMEAHGIFGKIKENLHFLISYSKLKNKLIEVCTKKCMYKRVYDEIPNFMYGNGTYTYVEAHVLFYKTWLIVLLTDASFEKLFESYERSFLYKEKLYKEKERDLYSLIFE